MIPTLQPADDDDRFETHLDHLAEVLKSYLPTFNEAVSNARAVVPAPTHDRLQKQHADASLFLQTWASHASGQPVSDAEFNGLRRIVKQIDIAIHQYGPVSRSTEALSMAAMAAIGK